MRKALLLPPLLLALGLAACGGGGSSSSVSTSASGAAGAEAKWGNEVEAVMRSFENHVSANATEQVHTTSSQAPLEPMYRAYGAALTALGKKLEATDAPAACAALRKRMGDDAHALGQLNTRLGRESTVNQEEFSAVVVQQEAKMHRYGPDLTKITYQPHC